MKKYLYKGAEYASEILVRKALLESEKKIFSKTPKENIKEFWSKFGVEYIEEAESLDECKARKSRIVKQAFLDWRNNKATLVSSLGFEADSNERANVDVNGLLVVYEGKQDETIAYRDANDQFHALTYEQLKVLQKEIIANGSHAYTQKWHLEAQIENAETKDELDSIEVVFEGKNFVEVSSDVL